MGGESSDEAAPMRNYSRLDDFLDRLRGDLYPDEPVDSQHVEITRKVIGDLVESGHIFPEMKVLDVGAGAGVASRHFKQHHCRVSSIDLQAPDGDEVYKSDQSFLPFRMDHFDLVWARHVIEHSPMPYFTLTEYYRVLKPGGFCYVEVPAPDTGAEHECNPNHYSVMGPRMWAHLMKRAGFEHVTAARLDFNVKQPDGSMVHDTYFSFLLRKDHNGSRTNSRE